MAVFKQIKDIYCECQHLRQKDHSTSVSANGNTVHETVLITSTLHFIHHLTRVQPVRRWCNL